MLADYRPPDYTIQEAHLTFRLDVEETVVEARLSCSATADRVQPPALVLDGEPAAGRSRLPGLATLLLLLLPGCRQGAGGQAVSTLPSRARLHCTLQAETT